MCSSRGETVRSFHPAKVAPRRNPRSLPGEEDILDTVNQYRTRSQRQCLCSCPDPTALSPPQQLRKAHGLSGNLRSSFKASLSTSLSTASSIALLKCNSQRNKTQSISSGKHFPTLLVSYFQLCCNFPSLLPVLFVLCFFFS